MCTNQKHKDWNLKIILCEGSILVTAFNTIRRNQCLSDYVNVGKAYMHLKTADKLKELYDYKTVANLCMSLEFHNISTRQPEGAFT